MTRIVNFPPKIMFWTASFNLSNVFQWNGPLTFASQPSFHHCFRFFAFAFENSKPCHDWNGGILIVKASWRNVKMALQAHQITHFWHTKWLALVQFSQKFVFSFCFVVAKSPAIGLVLSLEFFAPQRLEWMRSFMLHVSFRCSIKWHSWEIFTCGRNLCQL